MRVLLLLFVLASALSCGTRAEAAPLEPVRFTRGVLAGAGFTTSAPSSLAVASGGALFVADTNGRIQRVELASPTAIAGSTQITSALDLQEVFGIAIDATDPSPEPAIYVSNTVSGFSDAGQAPLGSYPGKITRLSGPAYASRDDVITGLPVSNSGHQTNGLAFGPDGQLYIAQGSTTNAGIKSSAGLFLREEVPTSAAMLRADIHAAGFDGNITYSPEATYSTAVTVTGGDVSVFASGLRNPYDLVFHSNGRLYATDNGPNAGYGPPSTGCASQGSVDANAGDELNVIVAGAYYGHPNRNRGQQIDVRECVYHAGTEASSGGYTAPIAMLPASSNGLAEYTAAPFSGQMAGDLLYVSWVDGTLHRVRLTPDGLGVAEDLTLASGFVNPLDVAVGPDGTIYVAEWGGHRISYLTPDLTAAPPVSLSAVAPNAGSIGGGTAVTISGQGFTTSADTTVTIGGAAATSVVVHNDTTITAVTPAGLAGAADVTVVNSRGTATRAGGYFFSEGGGTMPPVANAGPDWSGPVAHIDHAHVILDGRESFDPDGFIASYAWSEDGVVLSASPITSIQFTLGEHFVTLSVTDNDGLTSTDTVRVVVTPTAESPQRYYCFDVQGDGSSNSLDLSLIAQSFGKTYPRDRDNGYTRLRDWNADRTISAIDLMGSAKSFAQSCPLVDRQIRTATAAMEAYQDIDVAFAAGYVQWTQYFPGAGRHLVRRADYDTTFDPGVPEGLLYQPDPNTPGGWRLGGAMYVMPISLNPLVPDGFAGTEDAWHTHDFVCWLHNGDLTADETQEACEAKGGVWEAPVGWLLHLWNYVPNPSGRFVEGNIRF